MRRFSSLLALAALLSTAGATALQPPSKEVSRKQRLALLARAQVWQATDVAAMDLRAGPPNGAFDYGELVTCTYVEKKFGGKTPKFACARERPGSTQAVPGSDDTERREILKVRYGRDNGEIYAGIAATRLLWAFGFGADGLYPVRVLCLGCPAALIPEGTPRDGGILFDIAAIERPFAGEDIETPGEDGWSWDELDQVNQNLGGAPPAQRDALKLLAAFLQHTDNKPVQQRLVCVSREQSPRELAECADPFLMIHDVGMTFGRATLSNNGRIGKANLEEWSKVPVWKDKNHCVANLSASQLGTLEHPVISEGGRLFLARLLGALSDRQLTDLFTVAGIDTKPSGGRSIPDWVAVFKTKREEVSSRRCH